MINVEHVSQELTFTRSCTFKTFDMTTMSKTFCDHKFIVLWLHLLVVNSEIVKPLSPAWIPADIFSPQETYNHGSVIK